MSLISQNAVPKSRGKTRTKDSDEPAFMERDDNAEGGRDVALVMGKAKRRRKEKENELEPEEVREMQNLENTLFGSLYYPIEFGKGDEETEVENGSSSVFFDRSAGDLVPIDEENTEFSERSEDEGEGKPKKPLWGDKQRKPAWVDEEEEMIEVNIAKVNRLRKLRKEEDETVISGKEYVARLKAYRDKLNPGNEWAQLGGRPRNVERYDDESSDEDNGVVEADGYKDVEPLDDILRTNEDLVVKSREKLLPGLLEYSRLVDANAQDPSNGPIESVQFHRNAQLLLAAGLDRRLRFFQIDGKRNTKIQSIFIDDCPIRKASFLPDGSQVIIAGRRKFFYCFDLVKANVDKIGPLVGREEKSLEFFEVSPDSSTIAFVGNEGYILLVSSRTKELIGTLKMNGTVRSLAFADGGQQLLSHGGDGQVYHWDLRTRTCICKGVDEGCINGTALCTSPSGNLFAAGSGTGLVNVYNRAEFLGGKRKSIKAIENLTTKVDFLKFNNDAQILAICSHRKKNSLKLIHVPSFTVFSNWPPPNRPLYYPRCLDFSPNGGFMAVGNAAGKVLLYKLHHYHRA